MNTGLQLIFGVLLSLAVPVSVTAQPVQPASGLVKGAVYDLELANGSVLKSAIFREVKNEETFFDVPGVGERLALKNFKVQSAEPGRTWHFGAGVSIIAPVDQPALGFDQGIAGDLRAAISLISSRSPAIPQLAMRAGFTRLSGSKAILSGPEIVAGPLWRYPLDRTGSHSLFTSIHAGAAFYQLLNRNIDNTYSQTTFIGYAQVGYMYRYASWGYGICYSHGYIFDSNYPLQTGGINFSVTSFRGET